ncbi:ferredoxin:oxidoreductase FAD/NAD(P)-binding protein [Photobacterium kishitanii]|uniref:Ferredoxin:oxidoreductase FAD/NAD(P)-binding protein n=2 Tax=Photobacterium kishitanii TaxID=318456 RepID=A0AAX0YVC0_9GAMM|nr:molybdopterin-dependent oxidoreductase [Photobacterium kishitanii]KJG58256.1 ferredoxin:oxidoreductase FAD/NAD(P)-binding protein [Photobacterium kishitanii]KJG61882.1 ferredoxin:oxidoreductase FAD/NAD(P)-binding protein [Photobacterium kishitanii]KJG69874.1 ferredoxin:oxidoreductase FAD/NAD(P)-binding protein [Photobacterium kishitanii]PSX19156.1 ferredoxin:oxidoreductase FAD/NAD(P)-binding protein [Photobacterium kishitanii]PSX28897.1 ferredoxin:oxidoreductase FAD/NAD(P)-binding protein [
MSIEYKKGYCSLCRSRCGTINQVKNDKLIKVEPDPTHPTGAAMCMKGRAAPELVHNPNRIQFPMKRTTPKTNPDPGWQRISWDEALDIVSENLTKIKKQSGAEAVAFGVTTPSGTPMSDSIDWVERFIHAFGSPNICYGTEVCNWHKDHAHAFTFGCGMPIADYSNADLIMLWGHNPTNTWLSQANAIGEGRKRGARTLVIDPRKTPLAASADVWLQVKPGTDAAVAMGLIQLMITDDMFDQSFVRCWTNAPFLVRSDDQTLLKAIDCAEITIADGDYVVWNTQQQQLMSYNSDLVIADNLGAELALSGQYPIPLKDGTTVVCQPSFSLLKQACEYYTADQVEAISGVKAPDLLKAAKLIASSHRVAYHAWTGIAQQLNATQTERAIAILYALTGSFDQQGGNRRYIQPPINKMNGLDLMTKQQRAKALGLKERPLGPAKQGWIGTRDMYQAIITAKPYKVRGFVAFGGNLLLSQADTELGIEAFQQLEFHVHCDLFETPTTRYADVLLPVNTPWEREAIRAGFEINAEAVSHIQLRQQMVTSRGEAKSDTEIVFALAKKLGMGNVFFNGDIEAAWDHMLHPLGLTVAQLRKKPAGISFPLQQSTLQYRHLHQGKVNGFDTPSKRVEIYSETLLNAGYAPLPEIKQSNAVDVALPLLLTSVKNGYYCHSQQRNLVSLRKRAPLPMAFISRSVATKKGINNGDWIIIKTAEGQAHFCVSVDPDLEDNVVAAEYGWWQACDDIGRDGFPVSGLGSSNYNRLISARKTDAISGSVPMRVGCCDIALSTELVSNRRPWAGKIAFVITKKKWLANGVMEITFTANDNRQLPDYLAGQHISLCVNQGTAAEMTRAYSLTGAAQVADRTHYTITVRHQTGRDEQGNIVEGKMSSYLHQHLQQGDIVHLSAPSGNFTLPQNIDYPVVIFAGGIGITPFISFLESISEPETMPEVWLYYANLNSDTHAFADRLNALAHRMPKLHIINHYNDPLPRDNKGEDYATSELITAAVVSDTLLEQRARFYLCGPEPMMQAITEQLIERDVAKFDIFSEAFQAQSVVKIKTNQQFKVKFLRSKKDDVTWTSADGSILDFGDKMKIAMPSGCRVGQCESCAVRIVSGQVIHLNGKQPEDPQMCLACQAIPTSDLILDI